MLSAKWGHIVRCGCHWAWWPRTWKHLIFQIHLPSRTLSQSLKTPCPWPQSPTYLIFSFALSIIVRQIRCVTAIFIVHHQSSDCCAEQLNFSYADGYLGCVSGICEPWLRWVGLEWTWGTFYSPRVLPERVVETDVLTTFKKHLDKLLNHKDSKGHEPSTVKWD